MTCLAIFCCLIPRLWCASLDFSLNIKLFIFKFCKRWSLIFLSLFLSCLISVCYIVVCCKAMHNWSLARIKGEGCVMQFHQRKNWPNLNDMDHWCNDVDARLLPRSYLLCCLSTTSNEQEPLHRCQDIVRAKKLVYVSRI